MSSVFTKIIRGELPGRFVWRDDLCVAFLPIGPLADGHVLVVPIEEIDHWIDLPPALSAHVWEVARVIGGVLQQVFQPVKVGVLVVGNEVPHAHVHLVPFENLSQLDFANVDPDPQPACLDEQAARIRQALLAAGHSEADV